MDHREIIRRAFTAWKQTGSTVDCLDTWGSPENGSISLAFPRTSLPQSVQKMGRRLLWWPDGVCERRRVAIASSRIGERPHTKPWWFDALRTAVLACDPDRDCVVTASGTTTCDYAARAAALFGVPHLRIVMPKSTHVDTEGMTAWLHQIDATHRQSPDGEAAGTSTVYLSPELADGEDRRTQTTEADMCLVAAGERTVVLSATPGGNVDGAVSRCLQHRTGNQVILGLRVAASVEGNSPPVPDHLFEAGAVPWIVQTREAKRALTDESAASVAQMPPSVAGPLAAPTEWLTHWTRPRVGPWPEQSATDFLDELILGCATSDRSALASLLRIVESGTILKSSLSRDSVSFTEVPLASFRERRVYRRHLRRYDFEPWGIAVRKSVIAKLGGRPVEYVSPQSPDAEDSNLWYQHPATDQSRRIDWSAEREWRLPDALKLRSLQQDDVCVFVNTMEEVAMLQKVSPWPVICLPDDR